MAVHTVDSSAGQPEIATNGPGDPLPASKPVGHQGIRVEVEERKPWQGNGFIADACWRCSIAWAISEE